MGLNSTVPLLLAVIKMTLWNSRKIVHKKTASAELTASDQYIDKKQANLENIPFT
jgi:hypothetical protein